MLQSLTVNPPDVFIVSDRISLLPLASSWSLSISQGRQHYLLCAVLVHFLLVINKHHGHDQPGEERVYPILQVTIPHGGKARQELKAGA